MKNLKTVKVTVVQGAVGDQAASWMTDEDWKEHRKYVEQLKKDGNYLKPSVRYLKELSYLKKNHIDLLLLTLKKTSNQFNK